MDKAKRKYKKRITSMFLGLPEDAVVACKKCECGCDMVIEIKKWHFYPRSIIPKYIVGHHRNHAKGRKPGWKGGEHKIPTGYVCVYAPWHPNRVGNYVRKHRLLMEQHLGRYLDELEVVHHINGIKDDNRIENLALFSGNGEHTKLHRAIRRKRGATKLENI